MKTLLRCPCSSHRVQSHASTSLHKLKFPTLAAVLFFSSFFFSFSFLSFFFLHGHTKILHTLIGMDSAALAAAVPYSVKTTRISRKQQRSTQKTRRRKGGTAFERPVNHDCYIREKMGARTWMGERNIQFNG